MAYGYRFKAGMVLQFVGEGWNHAQLQRINPNMKDGAILKVVALDERKKPILEGDTLNHGWAFMHLHNAFGTIKVLDARKNPEPLAVDAGHRRATCSECSQGCGYEG